MREAIVHPLPELTVEIHEVPIPQPAAHEVMIKVAVAGSNVKDWDHITSRKISVNSGDDIAGTVHALGEDVAASGEFRVGDRVAAFHPMLKPGGAYAEYAVAPADTVFILPQNTSFEEAATIPLVTLTAALTLFRRQGLPPPWEPRTDEEPLPLIVYGASSALGSFAIKLAKLSNIHPIVAIAGGSSAYVSSLLDKEKGDVLVDYRPGMEHMKSQIDAALGNTKAQHALDAISSKGTWITLAQLVDAENAVISVVSGANKYEDAEIPSGVKILYTYVGTVHSGAYIPTMPKQPDPARVRSDPNFAAIILRFLARGLRDGSFEGHPFEIIPGGLDGVETGLNNLKSGKANGRKFVYQIGV